MKNTSPIIMAGVIAGWLATTAGAAPQAGQPAPETAAAPAAAQTNAPAAATAAPVEKNPFTALTSGTADQGLTLNLRGVSVDAALHYLTEKAGYTINRETSTGIAALGPATVDIVSETPVSKEELVPLFNKVLADHGLTAIQDKNVLSIMTLEQASEAGGTPVVVFTKVDDIPSDSEFVTEVINVHSLNPAQVIKDLYTLIPQGAKMNSNEAGNAVIMTAKRSDIRRFTQIIAAIDSSGNGDLEVFLLNYADSKAIAQELKDVFTSQDAGQGAGGNPFAMFARGGRGGGGGGGGGQGGDTERSGRATVHVNAVSDDQNNAVLVSAPSDFMPGISNIITKLDIPQEDTVIIRPFALHHADCTDVANELLALFPDPTLAANQNQNGNNRRGAMTFGGGRGGGFGGGGFGGGAAASAGGGMSDRMKKQVTVNAVPDPRTQTVLVTASKDTMAQIEKMIDELDGNDAGAMQVYVYYPKNGDALDFQQPLTDLFMANGKSSTTTSQQNALMMRIQAGAQLQSSSIQNSTTMSSVGGSGGGGSTGLRSP